MKQLPSEGDQQGSHDEYLSVPRDLGADANPSSGSLVRQQHLTLCRQRIRCAMITRLADGTALRSGFHSHMIAEADGGALMLVKEDIAFFSLQASSPSFVQVMGTATKFMAPARLIRTKMVRLDCARASLTILSRSAPATIGCPPMPMMMSPT